MSHSSLTSATGSDLVLLSTGMVQNCVSEVTGEVRGVAMALSHLWKTSAVRGGIGGCPRCCPGPQLLCHSSHELCHLFQFTPNSLGGNCTIPCYSGNTLCSPCGWALHLGLWLHGQCKGSLPWLTQPLACYPSSYTKACTDPTQLAYFSSWRAAWWGSLGSTSSLLILQLDLGHHKMAEATVAELSSRWWEGRARGWGTQEVKDAWVNWGLSMLSAKSTSKCNLQSPWQWVQAEPTASAP